MSKRWAGALVATWAALAGVTAARADQPAGRRMELTTRSEQARTLLRELQQRIENFQVGPDNVELAKKLVAADPGFAMGEYYMSAVLPAAEGLEHYDKS